MLLIRLTSVRSTAVLRASGLASNSRCGPIRSFALSSPSTGHASATTTSSSPPPATQHIDPVGQSLDLSESLSSAEALQTTGTSLAEPTFHSLGLGHAYPSGWLQSLMEAIHVHLGVPWWGTIISSIEACKSLLFFMHNTSTF